MQTFEIFQFQGKFLADVDETSEKTQNHDQNDDKMANRLSQNGDPNA